MSPKVRNQVDWTYFMEGNLICYMNGEENLFEIRTCGQYQVGDVVAIAQSYRAIANKIVKEGLDFLNIKDNIRKSAGWNN